MGGRSIGLWAYDILKQQTGVPMSAYELVERIAEVKGENAKGINTSNVTSALSKLARETPEMGIHRVQRGTYVFNPNRNSPREDEIIMRTLKVYEDGRMVLEGTDGEIYLAQKIDALWSK